MFRHYNVGVNEGLLHTSIDFMRQAPELSKLCVLMFDEMKVTGMYDSRCRVKASQLRTSSYGTRFEKMVGTSVLRQ